MEAELSLKGGGGPIRHYPPGFWRAFNEFWHAEVGRSGGQRATSTAVAK
jgi:hypothetical protein